MTLKSLHVKKKDVSHVYYSVIQSLALIFLEIFFTASPEVKEGTQGWGETC